LSQNASTAHIHYKTVATETRPLPKTTLSVTQ